MGNITSSGTSFVDDGVKEGDVLFITVRDQRWWRHPVYALYNLLGRLLNQLSVWPYRQKRITVKNVESSSELTFE